MNRFNRFTRLSCILGLGLLAACDAPEALRPLERPSRTVDLVVDEDFTFPSSFELQLEVHAPLRLPAQAYFQVCSEFEEGEGGRFIVDYGSCLVRGPLLNGTWSQAVTVPQHHESLITELWVFDEDVPPEQMVHATSALRASGVLRIE